MQKNTKETTTYKKPDTTYTEKLSKKEISEMLADYEEVTDLTTLTVGTHVRYFENKDGEMKFRTGGNILVTTGVPKYLVLGNGKTSWSVQLERCVIFKKISIVKIREEYSEKIQEKDKIIDELTSYVKTLKIEIIGLKKQLKNLK